MSNIFYNKVTGEIASYLGMKSYFPFSWPSNPSLPSVDEVIADTNPPNIFLDIYPTLADWERLYVSEPSGVVKLWENEILGDPEFSIANNRWEQNYTVEPKNSGEMIPVHQLVANLAKTYKDEKLESVEIEVNDIFSDATEKTRSAISDLIEYLQSEGSDIEVDWKGTNDVNGLPRWAKAKIADLQELSIEVTGVQQKAFSAEAATLVQQLDTPFDYQADVETFFNTTYSA